MSLASLKSRLLSCRTASACSTLNRLKGKSTRSITASPELMSREEWEKLDPYGWERSELAEMGIEIAYAADPSATPATPQRKLSRLEKIRACNPKLSHFKQSSKTPSRAPSFSTEPPRQPSSRLASVKEPPKPKRETKYQKHVASCKNCTHAARCRLAALGRTSPCHEWWCEPGLNVKWSDYV